MVSWWRRCRPLACGFLVLLTVSCGARESVEALGDASFARYVGSLHCSGCATIRADLLMEQGGDGARYSLLRTRIGTDGSQVAQEVQGRWKRSVGRDGQSLITLQPADRRQQPVVVVSNDQRAFARQWDAGDVASTGWLHRIDSSRESGTVDLGPGDALAPVSLHAGQRIRVHLRASPATGYEWGLDATPQDGALAIDSDPGVAVQARLLRTWGFRARHAGRVTLRFGYRRPWEANAAPLRSAAFEILVR